MEQSGDPPPGPAALMESVRSSGATSFRAAFLPAGSSRAPMPTTKLVTEAPDVRGVGQADDYAAARDEDDGDLDAFAQAPSPLGRRRRKAPDEAAAAALKRKRALGGSARRENRREDRHERRRNEPGARSDRDAYVIDFVCARMTWRYE